MLIFSFQYAYSINNNIPGSNCLSFQFLLKESKFLLAKSTWFTN